MEIERIIIVKKMRKKKKNRISDKFFICQSRKKYDFAGVISRDLLI